ncbi:MAG: septum formation initiator family protein [Alphaproteobacteria bacterium]|jgi:cell division protein FtsB|nr:septum formation initiator family protein [Alphaproteobacteria bacterium]
MATLRGNGRTASGRRLRRAAMPALLLAAALYLGYHMINGERGILAWMRLEENIATLAKEVAETREERQRLENRVVMLRPESLDPDLLEERAGAVLNLGRQEDLLVLEESEQP